MNQKAIDLTHSLAYQYTSGIHTYGLCSKADCKNVARGSLHCPQHLVEALVEEIGTNMAGRLQELYRARMVLNEEIHEIIEEMR